MTLVHGVEVDRLTAQSRLSLLAEASAQLAASLDLRAVARGVADSLVPRLADRAEVDLAEWLFRPQAGEESTSDVLFRVARAGVPVDPARSGADEWVAYQSGSVAAAALASPGPLFDESVGGALHVPLRARGRALGVLRLHRDSGLGYADEDVALAQEIGARAALVLDNVRLYMEARATSVTLQRALLPSASPRVTGVATAHRYLPGRRDVGVGGDWFDVIPLSCGRVAFVIGDVMGRGLRAAAAMGQLRTAVRMLAVLDHLPEDVLRHLDDLAQETDEVQLATCVYAVYDPVERTLSYATAGHPPPVLRSPEGATVVLPQPSGAPLGVGGVAFESETVAVEDGARLLLYTDGLVESRGEDIDRSLGELAVVLAASRSDLDALCDELLAATGRDSGHDDDVALLVTEMSGLEDTRVGAWTMHGGGESVSEARAWVARTFAGWRLASISDVAELLVSELVTNALRHGHGPVTLTALKLDGVVTLAVRDAHSPLPRLRRARDSDEGGRGLQLVSTLSARWGARPTLDGKVVWCDLALPKAPD
jgi:serine phosphatase RsbU (regulator of sigma subunit)/anti-sigma regulatory factor (Ser/Thr protein kinase)